MPGALERYFEESRALLSAALDHGLAAPVDRATALTVAALDRRLPVLVCGNGGSAADAGHIACELVGRFLLERQALPVMALAADPAILTALGNDYGYARVFARQVEAYGCADGVLWALSTSGHSENVIAALETARRLDMATIGFTGAGGGRMADLCDVLIDVPSRETPRIQEIHLCLYHYICAEVERRLAGTA